MIMWAHEGMGEGTALTTLLIITSLLTSTDSRLKGNDSGGETHSQLDSGQQMPQMPKFNDGMSLLRRELTLGAEASPAGLKLDLIGYQAGRGRLCFSKDPYIHSNKFSNDFTLLHQFTTQTSPTSWPSYDDRGRYDCAFKTAAGN